MVVTHRYLRNFLDIYVVTPPKVAKASHMTFAWLSRVPVTDGFTNKLLSRCDISLSMQFKNNGFYNPDPPRKKNKNTRAFGAKTSWVDSTLKQLLPLYFSILILDPDRSDLCTI